MTPKTQLAGFIARFDPTMARLSRAVLARMRAKMPSANLLVYDNYNALAIGFCPSDRTYDSVFSIAVFPRGVWELEDAKLTATERLIDAGAITIEERPDLDLALVRIPEREDMAHAYALHTRTPRSRLLVVHGRRVELRYRYERWVQITPSLHFTGDASTLAADAIAARVEHHLRTGLPAWNRYT